MKKFNQRTKNDLHYHHHTPNTRHYADVTNSKNNKDVLVNFEQYTIRETDPEDAPRMPRKSNDSGGTDRRPRTRDQDRREDRNAYPPRAGPPPQIIGPTASATSSKARAKPKKFIQCDALAFVISFAYILCIAITVLAIWCYRQDTIWNSVIRNDQPLPTLANENFFGGKHIYLYEKDEGLRHAKKHLLRENRWLELMHLMFMSGFLILTLFQLAAYVTRGNDDQSRLVICYYTVIGGLGLIVALFPLLSWHNQENSYKVAHHYLDDFARRVGAAGPSAHIGGPNTLATAQDAYTLGRIMKFCYEVSQDGLTIEEDPRFFEHAKRRYRLQQLQHLGFCTHHKFKIINTILSTIFALICCAIPCVYCFQAGETERIERLESSRSIQSQRQQTFGGPPPPYGKPQAGDQMEQGGGRDRRRHGPTRKHRYTEGEPLTERQMNEIEKFRQYIDAETDE